MKKWFQFGALGLAVTFVASLWLPTDAQGPVRRMFAGPSQFQPAPKVAPQPMQAPVAAVSGQHPSFYVAVRAEMRRQKIKRRDGSSRSLQNSK